MSKAALRNRTGTRHSWLTDARGILAIQIVYVLGFSLWIMLHGIAPSVELLFVLLVSVLIWRGQDRALLRDLVPFVFLFLCFRGLRSFADDLNVAQVHSLDLIGYERALCGGIIPAVWLQANLTHHSFTPLLDSLTSVAYMTHFLTPVVTAILLWHRNKSEYRLFVGGLLLLSYAGFVTFVLYPAAPPWWAAEHGHLPADAITLKHFLWPTLVVVTGPNPVAAMPSLHTAYPVYIALYCIRTWGKRASWIVLLPLIVAFSTLYLGHHYVVDVLAGVLYAVVSFGFILVWSRFVRDRGVERGHHEPTTTLPE